MKTFTPKNPKSGKIKIHSIFVILTVDALIIASIISDAMDYDFEQQTLLFLTYFILFLLSRIYRVYYCFCCYYYLTALHFINPIPFPVYSYKKTRISNYLQLFILLLGASRGITNNKRLAYQSNLL